MRIGLIAPIWEPVPPCGYGGIERVVDILARHLAARGHEVTLFATGDSRCEVPTAWIEPKALRTLGMDTWNGHLAEAAHLAMAYRRHREFDVLHNHTGLHGVAFAEACRALALTTLHGPVLPEHARLFRTFPDHPFVSISHAQRAGSSDLRYLGTVYNGIEVEHYCTGAKAGYLLFLGRISPEKGTHLAVQVAIRAGVPLVIAGKVDPYDREYHDREIAPHVDQARVRFVGEVDGERKRDLLSGAIALLHLVQWAEPFGLVLAEALASGTPVIAMPRGSIPEILEDGRTGFLVETIQQAAEAVSRAGRIDPALCRAQAVSRFGAARMVDEYLTLYERVATGASQELGRMRSG